MLAALVVALAALGAGAAPTGNHARFDALQQPETIERRFVPLPQPKHEQHARFVPLPQAKAPVKRAVTVPIVHAPMDAEASLRKRGLVLRADESPKFEPVEPKGQKRVRNYSNHQYTVSVEIGTPPLHYQVLLDTGSNGLWVWSIQCPRECPTSGFRTGGSSSYRGSGANFSTGYVNTHIEGEVVADTVSLAGYSVKSQEFGLTTNATGTGFANSPIIGILGMSWPGSSGKFPDSKPWWQNAMAQWPEKRFGIALSYAANHSTAELGGRLTLGGVDKGSFSGDLKYVKTLDTNSWSIPLDEMRINGQSVGSTGAGGQALKATFDSGTSGIMGPIDMVTKIYQKIPGAWRDEQQGKTGVLEYWRYPCEASPNVELKLGGSEWKIHPDSLWIFKNKHNASSTTETCLGNLFAFSSPNQWVLGDAFFHNAYVAFQYDPPAVGLAPLAMVVA